jgi:hypothetical protein
MMNRFSMDITRGVLVIERDDEHEKIPKVSSLCGSGGGEV